MLRTSGHHHYKQHEEDEESSSGRLVGVYAGLNYEVEEGYGYHQLPHSGAGGSSSSVAATVTTQKLSNFSSYYYYCHDLPKANKKSLHNENRSEYEGAETTYEEVSFSHRSLTTTTPYEDGQTSYETVQFEYGVDSEDDETSDKENEEAVLHRILEDYTSSEDDVDDHDKNINHTRRNKKQQQQNAAVVLSSAWNERFQVLLERPTTTPEEARQRRKDIEALVAEFVESAKPVVQRIVEELCLEAHRKTIAPVDVGGIAGGDKFITKQLFIKFAKDDAQYHLYGSDDFAQKAAGHELKSLNSLISCNVPNLHFPLMVLINYRGHRCIVMSKLPIGGHTLRYGSSDAGQTIHTEEKELARMMKRAAAALNLKGHFVEERKTNLLKLIYGPVDIEGHLGEDGRYYCADTARLFPPVTPNIKVRGCHLFRLLRPEYVKRNPTPLSSDVFTLWGRHNKQQNNKEVIAATSRLLEEQIPEFVKSFMAMGGEKENMLNNVTGEIKSLKHAFHEKGINMRYCGVVLFFLSQSQKGSMEQVTSADIGNMMEKRIWIEMVARSFRAILNEKMREQTSGSTNDAKSAGEQNKQKSTQLQPLVIDHLNLLLGRASQDVDSFWDVALRKMIGKRFVFCEKDHLNLMQPVMQENGEWNVRPGLRKRLFCPATTANKTRSEPEKEDTESKVCLLKLVLALCGIELKPERLSAMEDKHAAMFQQMYPIELNDLHQIGFTSKFITFIPFAETLFAEGNFAEAEEFYRDELRIKEKQLGNAHPQVAFTLANLADLYANAGKPKKAERVFLRALVLLQKAYGNQHMEVSGLLERMANLYSKYDQLVQSKTCIERSLRIKKKKLSEGDPAIASSLELLAEIHYKLGDLKESEKLYSNVLAIKTKVYGSEHWETAKTQNARFKLLFASGDLNSCETICNNTLRILRDEKGSKHSEVGIALDNLGQIYAKKRDFVRAKKLFKQALAIKADSLGAKHSFLAITLENLAQVYQELSSTSQDKATRYLECAEKCYIKAVDIFKETLGEEHTDLGFTLNNYASFLMTYKKGDIYRAKPLFEQAFSVLKRKLEPSHPLLLSIQLNLATIPIPTTTTPSALRSSSSSSSLSLSSAVYPSLASSVPEAPNRGQRRAPAGRGGASGNKSAPSQAKASAAAPPPSAPLTSAVPKAVTTTTASSSHLFAAAPPAPAAASPPPPPAGAGAAPPPAAAPPPLGGGPPPPPPVSSHTFDAITLDNITHRGFPRYGAEAQTVVGGALPPQPSPEAVVLKREDKQKEKENEERTSTIAATTVTTKLPQPHREIPSQWLRLLEAAGLTNTQTMSYAEAEALITAIRKRVMQPTQQSTATTSAATDEEDRRQQGHKSKDAAGPSAVILPEREATKDEEYTLHKEQKGKSKKDKHKQKKSEKEQEVAKKKKLRKKLKHKKDAKAALEEKKLEKLQTLAKKPSSPPQLQKQAPLKNIKEEEEKKKERKEIKAALAERNQRMAPTSQSATSLTQEEAMRYGDLIRLTQQQQSLSVYKTEELSEAAHDFRRESHRLERQSFFSWSSLRSILGFAGRRTARAPSQQSLQAEAKELEDHVMQPPETTNESGASGDAEQLEEVREEERKGSAALKQFYRSSSMRQMPILDYSEEGEEEEEEEEEDDDDYYGLQEHKETYVDEDDDAVEGKEEVHQLEQATRLQDDWQLDEDEDEGDFASSNNRDLNALLADDDGSSDQEDTEQTVEVMLTGEEEEEVRISQELVDRVGGQDEFITLLAEEI
ncbi:Histidine kinase A [Balamuthia mandrillaris]